MGDRHGIVEQKCPADTYAGNLKRHRRCALKPKQRPRPAERSKKFSDQTCKRRKSEHPAPRGALIMKKSERSAPFSSVSETVISAHSRGASTGSGRDTRDHRGACRSNDP